MSSEFFLISSSRKMEDERLSYNRSYKKLVFLSLNMERLLGKLNEDGVK
jgi:hypothetical protein